MWLIMQIQTPTRKDGRKAIAELYGRSSISLPPAIPPDLIVVALKIADN